MDASPSRPADRSDDAWVQGLPPSFRAAFGPHASPGSRVALIALQVDRLDRLGADVEREAAQRAARELLDGWEGHESWFVARDGDTWWVLIPDLDIKDALPRARALAKAGRGVRFEHEGRSRRLSVSCALAHSQHRSKPTLATCIAVAREGLRIATSGGVCLAVHSEVYGAFARDELPTTSAGAEAIVAPPSPSAAERQVELPRSGGLASSDPVEPFVPTTSVPPLAPPIGPPLESEQASELLQRRLTKLTVELEKAEAEIARLRAAVAQDEAGLASVYRTVQGLSADATGVALKRELMERLFRANVALRELTERQARRA